MSPYYIVDRSQRALVKIEYRLKHGMEKEARLGNHLTFLLRCRDNQLIPRGMTIKLPFSFYNSHKFAYRTSRALLPQAIRNTRAKRRESGMKSTSARRSYGSCPRMNSMFKSRNGVVILLLFLIHQA